MKKEKIDNTAVAAALYVVLMAVLFGLSWIWVGVQHTLFVVLVAFWMGFGVFMGAYMVGGQQKKQNRVHVKAQNMPKSGGQNVTVEVIKDLQQRDRDGLKKYGTSLQTFNGRDALIDAYQEAIDQVQYLKQAIMEKEAKQWK